MIICIGGGRDTKVMFGNIVCRVIFNYFLNSFFTHYLLFTMHLFCDKINILLLNNCFSSNKHTFEVYN